MDNKCFAEKDKRFEYLVDLYVTEYTSFQDVEIDFSVREDKGEFKDIEDEKY